MDPLTLGAIAAAGTIFGMSILSLMRILYNYYFIRNDEIPLTKQAPARIVVDTTS